jgi:hypothetical protein
MYVCSSKEVKAIRKAKKKAQYYAEINNERLFVMKDWTGEIRILNRESIKKLKKKRIFGKNVNSYNLEKEALFIADPPLVTRRQRIVKPI